MCTNKFNTYSMRSKYNRSGILQVAFCVIFILNLFYEDISGLNGNIFIQNLLNDRLLVIFRYERGASQFFSFYYNSIYLKSKVCKIL